MGLIVLLFVIVVCGLVFCRWAGQNNPTDETFRIWLNAHHRSIKPSIEIQNRATRNYPRSMFGRATSFARKSLDWIESGVNELVNHIDSGGSEEDSGWLWRRRDFYIFSLVSMSRNRMDGWEAPDVSTAYIIGFNEQYHIVSLVRILASGNTNNTTSTSISIALNNGWAVFAETALECLAFAPELERYNMVQRVTYGEIGRATSGTHLIARKKLKDVSRLCAKRDFTIALQRIDELFVLLKRYPCLLKSFEVPLRSARVACFVGMIQAMQHESCEMPLGASDAFKALSSIQLTNGKFSECSQTHAQYSRMLVLCNDLKGAARAEEEAAMVMHNCVTSASIVRERAIVQHSQHSAQLFIQSGYLHEASRLFEFSLLAEQGRLAAHSQATPHSPIQWAVLCILATGDLVAQVVAALNVPVLKNGSKPSKLLTSQFQRLILGEKIVFSTYQISGIFQNDYFNLWGIILKITRTLYITGARQVMDRLVSSLRAASPHEYINEPWENTREGKQMNDVLEMAEAADVGGLEEILCGLVGTGIGLSPWKAKVKELIVAAVSELR